MRIDGYLDDQDCPRVRIQAATGQVFDAVVNTAFSGDLWMPRNILARLNTGRTLTAMKKWIGMTLTSIRARRKHAEAVE